MRPPAALLGTVSVFTAPGLRDRDPRLQDVVVMGAHNPEFLQVRYVAASMEIFEMEFWDEAGSGGEVTRVRRGVTSDKQDEGKVGSTRSWFWRYCVVIGPLF